VFGVLISSTTLEVNPTYHIVVYRICPSPLSLWKVDISHMKFDQAYFDRYLMDTECICLSFDEYQVHNRLYEKKEKKKIKENKVYRAKQLFHDAR